MPIKTPAQLQVEQIDSATVEVIDEDKIIVTITPPEAEPIVNVYSKSLYEEKLANLEKLYADEKTYYQAILAKFA